MVLALRKFMEIDPLKDANPMLFGMYTLSFFSTGVATKTMLQYFLYAKSLVLYQSRPLHMELYKKAVSG